MKKKYLTAIGLIIAAIITMCGVMIPKQAEGNSNAEQQIQTVVLYAADGRQLILPIEEENIYLQLGWYKFPVITVYAPDGRAEVIYETDLQSWKNVGWYDYPVTYVYSLDGRVTIISTSEVNNWVSVGWYKEKPKNYSRNPFVKTNLSANELEKCLSQGLKGYGQAFYEMEQNYGINAIFAISVAELESGSGTSYAFKNKNNAFGIGPGKRFNSVQEGIFYFGQLMHKSTYYGKSIDQIGSIYCVGGNWANKVKNLMEQNYQQL